MANIDNSSFNHKLYDLLKVRGYKPTPLNYKNQRVNASQDADVIEFNFIKNDEDYGKVWVSIDDAQTLIVYYDEEQEDSPDVETPGLDYDDTWTGFLKLLKQWAQRKQMSFELSNKDRLGDDMKQREYYKMKKKLGEGKYGKGMRDCCDSLAKSSIPHIKGCKNYGKEKVEEGYYSMGKKASYNDAVPNVKIVLQHNRALEEGEQRYRNVAKIYLENVDGERFLAPTTRPGLARVYARHIAEGGVPNDERWNHIKGLCEEYSKMAGFVRATKNKQFNESVQTLVNEGINHYNGLRENLNKLTGHRGYNMYFESWTPTLMEDDGSVDISEMFKSSSLDPRIESVMPILSRLHKNVSEAREINELADWADALVNETMELDELKSEDPYIQAAADDYKAKVDKSEDLRKRAKKLTSYTAKNKYASQASDLEKKAARRRTGVTSAMKKVDDTMYEATEIDEEFKNWEFELSPGDNTKVINGDHAGLHGTVVKKHNNGESYSIKDKDGNVTRHHVSTLENPHDVNETTELEENLHKWFKEKWVRFGPNGKIKGPCARGSDSEGKPKCLPQKKAQALGKKGRASAATRKRKEDPNPDRHGKAINVATKKKKADESLDENLLAEKWSQKYKSSIDCSHPKGFSQKAHCKGRKKHNESVEMEMTCPDCGMCETHENVQNMDENCWKGYHKDGNKKMFGKTYPNCVKNESEEKCPHCGGELVNEEMINEKQDACYRKVKSRYKVWPSAYASGALVQCRKKGAKNWGNKTTKEDIAEADNESLTSNNPLGIPEGWDDPAMKMSDDIKVWQDADELGHGEWFWTRAKNGHIVDRGGPCSSREEAEAEAGSEELEENLGPEQKRVGQLGPTEKVKNNNIGKLVGANESAENDELTRILDIARFRY